MLFFLLTSVNALVASVSLESMEATLEAALAGMEKEHKYASPIGLANKMPKMELSEAVMKVKKLPSAVTDAMKIETPHLHKHHRHHHSEDAQLLQQQEDMKKKGIEEALDKAKETLSNMMEETETELDEAILSCKEYDAQTTSTLDTN